MIDFVQVGMKIMNCRKKAKLTQDELADMLYVSRQALSKWELGLSVPSIDTLINLSKIFKVSIDELLLLDKEEVINKNDIFSGHSRGYIINKIISNELKIDLPNMFHKFSPEERITLLKAIKDKKIVVSLDELSLRLTEDERTYLLGGNRNVQIFKENKDRW